ncbi:MAG: hypothetical protein SWH61_15690 [Thermodesulfobacteriota bacterium]|nr:hypothetical protein [Thermodesulfobacteriota bacterium]
MQGNNLKFIVSVIALLFFGCASLLSSPNKELFSWRYPKAEVYSVKELILREGYTVWGKEKESCVDYVSFVDCYTLNRYIRKDIDGNNNPVTILFSFKETTPPSEYYRNLAIHIGAKEDSSAVKTEIDRIENKLYAKILEIAGSSNVIRGER